jgi:dipeptidase E
MKRIFLTSEANVVIKGIINNIGNKVKGMRLVFIYTAAEPEGVNEQWLKDDMQALVDAGFNVFDYTITNKNEKQIRKDLGDIDVIFISGGNTFYLLEKIQQSGFANIIREYVAQGKIYIGSSAGSLVAGPDIYPSYRLDNVKKALNLKGYEGLGLVDFVVFPHWGSKDFRNLYLNKRLAHAYTSKHKIILLTNYQYVRVEDDWYKIEEVKH